MEQSVKSFFKVLVLVLSGPVFAAAEESDKGVWFFVLVKSNNYSQSVDGKLTLLNYHFFSEVFQKSPGSVKSARLQRLGDDGQAYDYQDKGDAFYYEGGHYDTLEEVDAAHPNGDYRFRIELASGEVVDKTLSLQGPGGKTDIPKPIHISFHQSGEQIAPNAVDPDKPLLVRWSPYSNGRANPGGVVDDMIFVVFQNCHGDRIFHTGLPFKEPSYMTFATEEVTIPVGRFKPGQAYSMFVEFPHVVDSGAGNAVPGFTSYATATYLDAKTTGEASEACPEKLPPLDTGQTDRMEKESAQAPSTEGPPGFVMWNSALIESTADRLEQELGEKPMVYQTIGNYEGHSMYLVLRGKTGTSEVHDTESDFYISMRGHATFVIGGELTEAEILPRKQRRGKSISGGTSHSLAPGDVLHVPVGVPHQIVIDPAEPYMYLLIKLDEEPINP